MIFLVLRATTPLVICDISNSTSPISMKLWYIGSTYVMNAYLHERLFCSRPFALFRFVVSSINISGNRIILTALNLCTHYLSHTPDSDISHCPGCCERPEYCFQLLWLSARDFVRPRIWFHVHSELGISRNMPYNPDTNGSCDRVNETLKSMLNSLTKKFIDS